MRLVHSFDRMHLVEHIRGIIFRLDILQSTQIDTINVGNGGVTGYNGQYCILRQVS